MPSVNHLKPYYHWIYRLKMCVCFFFYFDLETLQFFSLLNSMIALLNFYWTIFLWKIQLENLLWLRHVCLVWLQNNQNITLTAFGILKCSEREEKGRERKKFEANLKKFLDIDWTVRSQVDCKFPLVSYAQTIYEIKGCRINSFVCVSLYVCTV